MSRTLNTNNIDGTKCIDAALHIALDIAPNDALVNVIAVAFVPRSDEAKDLIEREVHALQVHSTLVRRRGHEFRGLPLIGLREYDG